MKTVPFSKESFKLVPGSGPDESPIIYVLGSDLRFYWTYADRENHRWYKLPPLPDNDGDE